MELVNSGPIIMPSTSNQMVRSIATEPEIKREAGVVVVVVAEAIKETRSNIMEMGVISLSSVRIVT
jgi:hypothetical protein